MKTEILHQATLAPVLKDSLTRSVGLTSMNAQASHVKMEARASRALPPQREVEVEQDCLFLHLTVVSSAYAHRDTRDLLARISQMAASTLSAITEEHVPLLGMGRSRSVLACLAFLGYGAMKTLMNAPTVLAPVGPRALRVVRTMLTQPSHCLLLVDLHVSVLQISRVTSVTLHWTHACPLSVSMEAAAPLLMVTPTVSVLLATLERIVESTWTTASLIHASMVAAVSIR